MARADKAARRRLRHVRVASGRRGTAEKPPTARLRSRLHRISRPPGGRDRTLDIAGHLLAEVVGYALVRLFRGVRWLFGPLVRLLRRSVGDGVVFETGRWMVALVGFGWLYFGLRIGMADGRELPQLFATSSVFGAPVALFAAISLQRGAPSRR